MGVLTRGVKNAFRSGVRSVAVILMEFNKVSFHQLG